MTPLIASLVFLALIVVVVGSGVWIFVGLMLAGTLSLATLLGMPLDRIGSISSRVLSANAISWELAAIPMFLLMGEMIHRTNVSDRLFNGLAPLVRNIPGGLIHTNVLGCTVFAAVSGSSVATTATVGKITVSQLLRRGYNGNLVTGSLAGAGTFGLMIPPSMAMIIYGILAQASISKLFIAGILPGLMMAGLYGGFVMLRAVLNPSLAPADKSEQFGSILYGLGQLSPIFILVFVVLGSIYSGLATPTEAAAVGVATTVVLAASMHQLSARMLFESFMAAVQLSSMIGLLVISAAVASSAVAYLGIPETLAAFIDALHVGPYMLIFLLAIFYIILGTAIEGTAMLIMTVPIVLPLVVGAGWDPIWFGIFLILMIELSALTPPVGLNLNILQGLTGYSFNRVFMATIPFFLLLCLGAAILTMFPQIVLWLPDMMAGG